MKLTYFHLFIIILAALIFCRFLGGANCYQEGMTSSEIQNQVDDELMNATEDDETVKIVLINKNGEIVAKRVETEPVNNTITTGGTGSINYYYTQNGNKIVTVEGEDGNHMVVETDDLNNNNNIYTNQQPYVNRVYVGPEGNKLVTGPYGNKVVVENDATVNNVNNENEDLYILKSQVVPPVCPACPGIAPAYLDCENNKVDDTQQYPEPVNNNITSEIKQQAQRRQQLRSDINNDASPEQIKQDVQNIAQGRQELKQTIQNEVNNMESQTMSNNVNQEVLNTNGSQGGFNSQLNNEMQTYNVPTFKSNSNNILPKPVLSDFSSFT